LEDPGVDGMMILNWIYLMQTNVHCYMLFNTIFIKCCLQQIYSESTMTVTDINNQVHLTAF
jgi:hypothetical protein